MISNDTIDKFTIIESRNAKLILENRKLKSEVDRLREEKQLMYKHLLRMKNEMNEHFDKLGKVYFADDFYEE